MVQIIISLALFVVSFSEKPIPSEERCNKINKCYNPITQQCDRLAPCPKIDYCNGPLTPTCPAYPSAQCKFTGCGGCNTYFVDKYDQIIRNCDADICTLPAEPGNCRAAFQRYYFNDETQQCEKFIYGGCDGNGNNFNTLEECENKCSNNICNLPAEVGPCDAAFPRYFYNDITGHCQEFIYGGCKGNENNFNTLAECQQKCDNIPHCVPEGGSFMGDPQTCTLIDFICGPNEDHWFDYKCGCGCKPKTNDIPDCVPDGYTFAGNPQQCMVILYVCPDDMQHWSTPGCGCGCKPKDEPMVCTTDVKQCSDGSFVSRDPLNDCQFNPCPKCNEVKCLIAPCDVSWCDNFPGAICTNNYCDGCNAIWTDSYGNDVTNQCTQITSTTIPTAERMTTAYPTAERMTTAKPMCVPEGWSFAGDNDFCVRARFFCGGAFEYWSKANCGCGCKPKDNPVKICTTDVKECSDGTFVSRDPLNKCEFPKCPKCNEVECIVEPCEFSWCDNFPGATCTNDYCGGCNAIWTDLNGNDVTDQCKKTTTTTKKPECVPDGWSFVGDNDLCARIFFICDENSEYWWKVNCGCGCRSKCKTGGCSGQVCSDSDKNLITTCEWKCEYGCRRLHKTCGRGINNDDMCQWYFMDDASEQGYKQCVNECGGALSVNG